MPEFIKINAFSGFSPFGTLCALPASLPPACQPQIQFPILGFWLELGETKIELNVQFPPVPPVLPTAFCCFSQAFSLKMPNLSVACRTEAKQLNVGLREVGCSAKEPGGNVASRTSKSSVM